MQSDTAGQTAYFDTPARSERLQLVRHLVRNASTPVYLRGPAGAGKTHFVHRLLPSLRDEAAVIWLDASVEDLPAKVARELGLPQAAAAQWPTGVLAGVDDQDLILVVDDAHRLAQSAVHQLSSLHAAGGRLLLMGQGDVGELLTEVAPQFVDLPGFDVTESASFLRLAAGRQADGITDEMASSAHQATGGFPGPLLDALSGLLPPMPMATDKADSFMAPVSGRKLWPWLLGAVGAVVLAAVLVFQDRINSMIDPSIEDGGDPGVAKIDRSTTGKLTPAKEQSGDLEQAASPSIDLPELSRASSNGYASSDDLAADSPTNAAETASKMQDFAGSRASADPTSQTNAEIDTDDPLEAVMQDALSAMDQAPSVEGDGTSSDAAPAEQGDSDVTASPISPGGESETQSSSVVTGEGVDSPPVSTKSSPESEEAVSTPPASVATARAVETLSELPKVELEPVTAPAPDKTASTPEKTVDNVVQAMRGDAWLSGRKPARYTLQLVGGRERASVERFASRNNIKPPYAIFQRQLNGRPWYSLVAGDYADRDAAVAARARLPRRLQDAGIWPRTFESILNSN